jgi:hypothetical protein
MMEFVCLISKLLPPHQQIKSVRKQIRLNALTQTLIRHIFVPDTAQASFEKNIHHNCRVMPQHALPIAANCPNSASFRSRNGRIVIQRLFMDV